MVGNYITKSPDQTKELASKVAKSISQGDIIALIGDLGTGKTAFTQGFAKAIGIEETVGSPTFKLISEYQGISFLLYHIDCYRLENVQQFVNIGGDEYLASVNGVTVIEWADIIEEILPVNTIKIHFKRKAGNPDHRELIVS
jgi:tRNA threonylcarbamoyladenosine biosynthesis protein TsaE